MSGVSFSFIVPTAGRKELEYCLASIEPQLGTNDEVLIIGDTLDGPLPVTESIVNSFDSRFRYLEWPDSQHTYGHRQINHGIRHASGTWLQFNDDDDIWTMGAVDVMREAAETANNRPVLFRFMTYHGFVAWTSRNAFMQDQIGGHCIVCPNIEGKVGLWGDRYQGDWDFIESTVNLHGGVSQVIWREELICIARPNAPTISGVMANAGRTADISMLNS